MNKSMASVGFENFQGVNQMKSKGNDWPTVIKYDKELVTNYVTDLVASGKMKTLMNQHINSIKYKLADQMRNSMHIPDEFLEHLEMYHLVHWVVPQFKKELINGQIIYWDKKNSDNMLDYNVIYYNTTPAAAKSAKEIRLSFRKAKPEFNIEPYVLVQIVEQ